MEAYKNAAKHLESTVMQHPSFDAFREIVQYIKSYFATG